MFIGYARTSTVEQRAGLDAQLRDLTATGCNKTFSEQVSSVSRRVELEMALDFCREGDTLVVTKLDRLARSTLDLLAITNRLEAKGVSLRVLDFGGSALDTKGPTGKLILTVVGAIGEFERSLMLQRQREGIAAAKALGKYKGRAPTARAKSGEIRKLRAEGLGASHIAKQLNIGRASVYRVLSSNV